MRNLEIGVPSICSQQSHNAKYKEGFCFPALPEIIRGNQTDPKVQTFKTVRHMMTKKLENISKITTENFLGRLRLSG